LGTDAAATGGKLDSGEYTDEDMDVARALSYGVTGLMSEGGIEGRAFDPALTGLGEKG
jgi:hypothetical protein